MRIHRLCSRQLAQLGGDGALHLVVVVVAVRRQETRQAHGGNAALVSESNAHAVVVQLVEHEAEAAASRHTQTRVLSAFLARWGWCLWQMCSHCFCSPSCIKMGYVRTWHGGQAGSHEQANTQLTHIALHARSQTFVSVAGHRSRASNDAQDLKHTHPPDFRRECAD